MPALVAIEVTVPPCALVAEHASEQTIRQGCDQPDTAAMLEACNAALYLGACVAGSSGIVAEQLAQVNVSSRTSITIEVRARAHSDSPTVRLLTFTPADEAKEKWRTVGFTTALLVEGRTTDVASNHVESTSLEPAYVAWVAGRLVGASGFGVRSPKAGGHLHVAGRAWQAPWFVGVSAEYTSSAWATPSVTGDATWSEFGLGVSAVIDVADDLDLLVHVSGLAQRLAIAGQKKAESGEAALWQPGLRCAAELAWPLYARWYGLLGVHATWVAAAVELRADDKVVARVPAVGGGVNIGIQYRF
jgi:hypothetical protein